MTNSGDRGGSDGSISSTALVEKLLGIQASSLRFRHHGLKQKPHLILRRVEDISDDESDDGELNHSHRTARFSLFAMKRIDVKPGKELLLCVATETEAFKDTPLVLEAEEATKGEDKNPGDVASDVVQQKEVVISPVEVQVVPPKMRRTWTKKTEVPLPSSTPIATRVCVGVQAVPEMSSKAVEAMSEQHSISVQARPVTASASVQTAFAVSPSIVPLQNPQVPESPLTTPPSSAPLPPSLELLPETPETEHLGLPEAPAAPLTGRSKRKQRGKDRKNAKRRRLRAERREALAQLEGSQLEEGEWSPDADEDEEPIKTVDLNAGTGNPAACLDTDRGYTMNAPIGLASQESSSTLIGDGEASMDLSDDHSDRSLSPMELDSPSSSALSSPATSCFPVSLPTTLSTGSASPTLTSKDLPLGLLLKGPQSAEASQAIGPDRDPATLLPLTPLPSSDDSDPSPPLQVYPSGLVSSKFSASTPPESPSYTPSALTLPELTDVPAAQRDLDSAARSPPQGSASVSEPQPLDKQGKLQETMVSGASEHALPIKPASEPGSRDIFVRAASTSGSSLDALPSGVTMFNPEGKGKKTPLPKASGGMVSGKCVKDLGGNPVILLTTQSLPKISNSRTKATRVTPPRSSLPSESHPTSQSSRDPPTIPTGPKSLVEAKKDAASFPPTLVPVDPRQIARPVSGPSNNPLNIAPSRMPASMRKAMSGVVPPTGPRLLLQSSSRKPVVIGAGWSAGKGGVSQGPAVLVGKKKVAMKGTAKVEEYYEPTVSDGDKSHVGDASHEFPTPPPPPSECPAPPPPPDTPPTIPPPLLPSPIRDPPKSAPTCKWEKVGAPKFAPAQTTGSVDGMSHLPTPPSTSRIEPFVPSSSRLEDFMKVRPPSPARSARPPSPNFSNSSFGDTSPKRRVSFRGRVAPTSAHKDQTKQILLSAEKKESTEQPKKPLSNVVLNGFTSGGVLKSTLEDLPSQPATSLPPDTSPSTSLSTLPHHPSLPAKPPQSASQGSSYRGVKRDRPISPEISGQIPPSSSSSSRTQRDRALSPTPRRRTRPNIKCPTIKSSATKRLQGDGEPYMRTVSFSSDGSYFVLGCSDKTVRVWSTKDKTELARLMHHSPIVNAFWLDGDTGVIVLTTDGLVSKWTKSGENSWKWAKILSAGTDTDSEDSMCFAYTRDRVAVSFPRGGVKVWVWSKGNWQAQRSILRQNVTAIKFIEGGQSLLGGTRDGTLWSCEVPNGTLRACAFLKNKIISLDLCPLGTHLLVGFSSGGAILVGSLSQAESKGNIESVYSLTKESDGWVGRNEYGATLATQGQAIVFGTVDSCALVWDRKKGNVVYGLEHEEDEIIQATAAVDSVGGREGCMLTGTRNGHLCWWALPVAAGQGEGTQPKKQKVES